MGRRAHRSARLALAAVCCLSALPSFAQTASPDTVVVTATRTAQAVSRVLADISVLERDAIERSGAVCLADLLARLPGIEFARNGGPAGVTSVFIRGAESRHTAVYLDGLRIDSQATGGAPWELLPVNEIERVEVLRGPAAAVYGSDAVAGVVQLFTQRGRGGLQASGALQAGSQDTLQARAALSGATGTGGGAVDYALSASQGRSRGFNARETATSNPDADGWQRGGVQARLGWQLTADHRLEAALLASRLRGQFDQGRTDDDVARQTLQTVGLSWQGRWSAVANTRVQLGESRNTYESQPSYYRTDTTLRNFVLQHSQRLAGQQLDLTLERRDDELRNPATAFSSELRGQRQQNALGLGWRAEFGAHAWQAHLRHDHDSEFGNQPTGSLAWGWQWARAWRATASVATAFRAPTLYQRFSEYGTATLQPEKARNLELGLRWAEAGTEFSATAWRNQVRNLIDFGGPGACASPYGCYENAGRVRYEGVTLAAQGKLAGVALHGALDWHDPRNLDTDKLLGRRARALASLGADGEFGGWGLGLEWKLSGARYDTSANLASQRMGGYGVVNLRATRPLSPTLALDLRLDNAGDKDYQLARTYPTGGRTALVGLRWRLAP